METLLEMIFCVEILPIKNVHNLDFVYLRLLVVGRHIGLWLSYQLSIRVYIRGIFYSSQKFLDYVAGISAFCRLLRSAGRMVDQPVGPYHFCGT